MNPYVIKHSKKNQKNMKMDKMLQILECNNILSCIKTLLIWQRKLMESKAEYLNKKSKIIFHKMTPAALKKITDYEQTN